MDSPTDGGIGHALARFDRIHRSRLGYTILGRAVPATIFGFVFGAKLLGLIDQVRPVIATDWSLALVDRYAMVAYQILVLVFLANVCLLFIIRLPSLTTTPSLKSLLISFGGTFAGTPLAFAPLTTANMAPLGAFLMLTGYVIAIAALWQLGRCFGVTARARGLVTSGPYRWARHPLYLGEEIATLGVLLPVLAPATLAIFLLHCALQFARAIAEESVLGEVFPQYEAYRHQVARFIPRIY